MRRDLSASLLSSAGRTFRLWLLAFALAGTDAWAAAPAISKTNPIQKASFGKVDGKPVEVYTLTNTRGAFVRIITYGAIVTELHVPDRAGKLGDVVLGYDSLDGYLHNVPYFGAVVGRYANRIAKGRFRLTLYLFLQQHYVSNSSSAWALASYLESVEGGQSRRSHGGTVKPPVPRSPTSRFSLRPPMSVPNR